MAELNSSNEAWVAHRNYIYSPILSRKVDSWTPGLEHCQIRYVSVKTQYNKIIIQYRWTLLSDKICLKEHSLGRSGFQIKFCNLPARWPWTSHFSYIDSQSLWSPVVYDSAIPWTAACQASLSITSSRSLFKFMSIELVMPSNHLILSGSLLLLPSIFPVSGSFQMSQLYASSGQSIGVSVSASFLPMNIQDWFPLRWTGWISLQSKGLLRVFSNTTFQKHQFFGTQLSLYPNSHIHTWLLEKS